MGTDLTEERGCMQSRTEKDSGFEYMRIAAMIAVVCGHWYGQCGSDVYSGNNVLVEAFCYNHRIANLAFLFISCYFLQYKKWKFERFMSLWLKTFIETLALSTLSLWGFHSGGVQDWIRSFFPIFGVQVWYISAYLIFLLIHPFLEESLDGVSVKTVKSAVLVLGMLIVVLPTFLPLSYEMTAKRGGLAFNVAIFILVYLVMRLYRLAPECFVFVDHKKRAFLWMVMNWIIIVLVSHFFEKVVPVSLQDHFTSDWYWNNYNTLFSFGCVLGSFFFIKNLHMKYHPIINKIGSMTVSVYIVHQNPSFIDPLWKMISYLQSRAGIDHLLLCLVSVVCIVFLLSWIIDWITGIFVVGCMKTGLIRHLKKLSENLYK